MGKDEQKTATDDCWISKDLIEFNEPGILWELDKSKFNDILHSPVCSEIYHEDVFSLSANNFKKKFGKKFNKDLHANFVSKVSGFLEKTGSLLVTGFRGVGKSSVINRAIYEYILKKKESDGQKEAHELECPILISIPLEHSIEKHSLIKMIFDLVSSHEETKKIVINKCQEAISSKKIRQNFTLAISLGTFLFPFIFLFKAMLFLLNIADNIIFNQTTWSNWLNLKQKQQIARWLGYLVPERKPCFSNRNFYRFFGE